jgi:SCY1-like protein 1
MEPETAVPEASETLGITSPAQATLVNSAAGAAGALAGWAISSLGKKVPVSLVASLRLIFICLACDNGYGEQHDFSACTYDR